MTRSVLLVVDVQTALIEAISYNKQKTIDNIKELISAARDNQKEVIYVRHDVSNIIGQENDIGKWDIYSEVAPDKYEMIFNKQYNSAFYQTDLKSYLESKEIDTIILVGLQTEYCIDTTCKVAFEYGYKVIIPEETNTTFDNEYLPANRLYEYYNHKIWDKRFASVIPVKKVIEIFLEDF